MWCCVRVWGRRTRTEADAGKGFTWFRFWDTVYVWVCVILCAKLYLDVVSGFPFREIWVYV